ISFLFSFCRLTLRASLPGGGGYELREKELGKLHRAAAGGDLGRLQQLLKKHDINQLDKENRTPLHLACANGHSEVVTYLVDNKCKLNLCDNDNRSPLMKAVQCQQEKCATMLLEHGADPNLVDVNSNTALHLTAQTANISLAVQLLEYNAHIDAQNKEGYTPLTIAITENHQEMVEFLLRKGADVHFPLVVWHKVEKNLSLSLFLARCLLLRITMVMNNHYKYI
uniref:Ankyrin repeat domain 7 n=1 Tax=Chelydra serpentina TaxID=8475 RepID=A0A8C3XS48_CHESE